MPNVNLLGDNWGSETSPSGYELQYAQIIESEAPGIVNAAMQVQAVGESLLDAIARVRLNLAMTDAQREMIELNLQRARAGIAPYEQSNNLMIGLGLLIAFALLPKLLKD